MPIALRGPRKAMRGKCERGRGSANADGGSVNAGAEVQTRTGRVRKSSRAMGTRRRRLSAPWPRFHGADRPDVYIIIHVRACCCGECALNPPTAQHIPRRRSAPAPAQRRALPAHFRSLPAPTHARRLRDAFFADPTTHFPPKICSRPSTATRPSPALLPHPRSADAHPPTSQHIPRRKPAPAPAAPRCLPFRSASGTKNGTAQWMCDAECLGRPSLRSVIGVGEPRAVRRRCGALACRRGA